MEAAKRATSKFKIRRPRANAWNRQELRDPLNQIYLYHPIPSYSKLEVFWHLGLDFKDLTLRGLELNLVAFLGVADG